MDLVKTVVPLAKLEEETVKWCEQILQLGPLALRMLKRSFNAALDGQAGIQELAGCATGARSPSRPSEPGDATMLFYMTEEAGSTASR